MRLYRCVSIDGIEDRHTAYESPRVYLDRMQGYVGLTPLYRRAEDRAQSNYVRHLSLASFLRTFSPFVLSESLVRCPCLDRARCSCLPSFSVSPVVPFLPFLIFLFHRSFVYYLSQSRYQLQRTCTVHLVPSFYLPFCRITLRLATSIAAHPLVIIDQCQIMYRTLPTWRRL